MKKSFITFLERHMGLTESDAVLVIVGSVIGCVLPCAIVKVIDSIETKKEKSEEGES